MYDLTKDEVIELQTILDRRGFAPGPIDGIAGPRTGAAVIAFKKSIGYRARSYVGPLTWEALRSPMPPKTKVTTAMLPWIKEGYKVMGWHEVYDNEQLTEWMKSDGKLLGDPAQLPWCGDFVDTCLRLALPDEPRPGALGRNPYWALNWRELGISCGAIYGAVASISRPGGGHVGFLVGEDASRYYLLGGNQSNRVSVAPMSKSRFSSNSFRYPSTYLMHDETNLPWITSSEASSLNEA